MNTSPSTTKKSKKSARDTKWQAKVDQLVAYRDKHGRWPSARATDADERSLGAWVGGLRGAALGGRGADALTTERVEQLDQRAPSWTDGTAKTTNETVAPTEPLLMWRGEPVGGSAAQKSARDLAWDANLAEYRVRIIEVRAFSTSLRNSDDVEDARSALWLMTQRNSYKHGTLSADRTAALEQVPGHTWDARATSFKEGLAALDAYIKEHGTFPGRGAVQPVVIDMTDPVAGMQMLGRAIRSSKSEHKVGHWLANQRRTAGSTPADRLARIDEIAPGWRGSLTPSTPAGIDEWQAAGRNVRADKAEAVGTPGAEKLVSAGIQLAADLFAEVHVVPITIHEPGVNIIIRNPQAIS